MLKEPKSELTHAALIGLRKQSLKDAERLLSYHVVESLQRHGHQTEAEYVHIVANWHNATDGRGLTQLERCKYNYEMLNDIMDKWMPWHKDGYYFSTIDINRCVDLNIFPILVEFLHFIQLQTMYGTHVQLSTKNIVNSSVHDNQDVKCCSMHTPQFTSTEGIHGCLRPRPHEYVSI